MVQKSVRILTQTQRVTWYDGTSVLRLEVPKAVNMKSTVLHDVTPCRRVP